VLGWESSHEPASPIVVSPVGMLFVSDSLCFPLWIEFRWTDDAFNLAMNKESTSRYNWDTPSHQWVHQGSTRRAVSTQVSRSRLNYPDLRVFRVAHSEQCNSPTHCVHTTTPVFTLQQTSARSNALHFCHVYQRYIVLEILGPQPRHASPLMGGWLQ